MSSDVDIIYSAKIKYWAIVFVIFGFLSCPSISKEILSKSEDAEIFKDSDNKAINSNGSVNSTHSLVSREYNKTHVYRKCHCDLFELRGEDKKCQSVDIELAFEAFRIINPNEHIFSQNSELPTVKIEDLKCPNSHLLTIVDQDEFFLFENGELYNELLDLIVYPENYCLEFINGLEGLRVIAKICIPLPEVPICSSKYATDVNSLSASINISFGSILHEAYGLKLKQVNASDCKDEYQMKSIPLENENADLYFDYLSGNLRLVWTPPFPATVPQVFSEENYCLIQDSKNDPQQINIKFCYDDPLTRHLHLCKHSTCVRKCCPKSHVYDLVQRKCLFTEENNNIKSVSFYDIETKQTIPTPGELIFEYSFPWCQPRDLYVLDPHINPTDEFVLLEDGSLYVSSSKLIMNSSKYCLDNFLSSNDGQVTVKAISCFTKPVVSESKCLRVHKIMYPILIAISCAFLSITLMVYAAIPEFRTKLHGKSLISHVSSLLMAFLCQLIVSWSSSSLSMIGCKIIGLGNQISFLWAFFWLNVMCFDIWWTLKSMRIVPETGEDSRRRFFLYSLYAWGCPVVICFFTAVLEFLPKSIDKTGLILPGFGLRGCWFQDVLATWIYFHGFTLTLYVLNIYFFFHVATILIRGQKSTEGILRTTKKQHRERVYLYLKLFLVMGITWICEVASWQEGTCEYWIFTDIVNSLQGVMIFIIFMCNQKVFQKIQAKGAPIIRRVKSLVRIPSTTESGVTGVNSTTPRTSQTSEDASRRLSSSASQNQNQLIQKF